MDHQPKISTPEAFVLMIVAVIADLINWVPGLNFVVTIFTFGFQAYFWFKKIPGVIGLIGNLAELIPGLSVLPAISAAIGVTIYVDRHPESGLAQQISRAAVLKSGGGAAAAGPKILNAKGALAGGAKQLL